MFIVSAHSLCLFQVDAGGGGVLRQQIGGSAGVHQMAKCQLLQTLSQVGVLGRNPGADEQLTGCSVDRQGDSVLNSRF